MTAPNAIEKPADERAAEETAANAADELAQQEAQALKDFTEGFSDEKVEPTAEEKKAAEDKAAQEEADRVAAEAAAKAAEPVLAKPSEQEFQALVKKANTVDEVRALAERVRDTANGRLGSLEQTIKKLQEATPIGQKIIVTPEDFAEIGKDLPDHAKMLADGLTRVLSKLTGTATSAVPAVVETPEQFEERVNRIADERMAKREQARIDLAQKEAREDLSLAHPDWETVIGPKDSATDFRQYLDTQPPLYKKRILNTNDADVLSEALTKFKTLQEEKKKVPVPTTSERTERLKEAVPARGGAAPPSTHRTKTPEEDFAEGFNS